VARANPLRFSTKYQDDETDLLYYGYRFYSASTGRWLSLDRLPRSSSKPLYCFVGNCPGDRIDSIGLDWIDTTTINLFGEAINNILDYLGISRSDPGRDFARELMVHYVVGRGGEVVNISVENSLSGSFKKHLRLTDGSMFGFDGPQNHGNGFVALGCTETLLRVEQHAG
jgi:RHS repeat-associated protein